MNLGKNSIQIKIMMFFIILSTVLFVTVGFLFFKSTKDAINLSKEKEFITLAEETSNKIERYMFERYGDIQVMVNSPLLKNKEISDSLMNSYLDSVRNAYKAYDYILVTNLEGKVLAYSGNLKADNGYEGFLGEVLKGKSFVSDFTYFQDTKSYGVYYAAPILDDKGKIKGAVVERMNFNAILDIISNVRLGEKGYAFLVDSNGNYINHPFNSMEVIKTLNNSKYASFYTTHNNVQYFSALYGINKYDTQKNNWYVVVEEPVSEAYEVAYRLRTYTVIVLMISVAIVFVLVAILSRKIAMPIKNLVKETKNIAEGDMGQNINIQSRDEIGSLAESFNKMLEKLEESVTRAKSLEALGALSAGMAHEIRNPLTSIKGYAQYIMSEMNKDSELYSDMAVISSEVDRLNNIIDRFLAFARPNELKLEKCDINDIVKEVITLIKRDNTFDNIKLNINFGEIPLINADFEQMKQVILNIAINGVQSMPQGGELTISTFNNKILSMVEIEISDTGQGISHENVKKIFEPYFTTKDKGIGLGLAICSRIVDNHRGIIEVESIPEKGSKFIIKLPEDN
ncbi:cache domain-containing protein [Candidatus Clostridium radicumherbarum]|uniref:histidine kinase n=1 Tax=Candidatus Clostridium radicumherbarum TaxID=3381662 RepID=A0ABW8TV88_9CLOT